MTYGTSYFVSHAAAVRYYRATEGKDAAGAVERKLAEGQIHLGKPDLKPGEVLTVIDNGTRYAIKEAEAEPEVGSVGAVEAVLRRESAYALDIHFARVFSALTGRPDTSVLYMVRSLADKREREMSGRDKQARSVRSACESVWDWYNSASEYRQMSTAVALDMLESHEPACLWAVILGQSKEGK